MDRPAELSDSRLANLASRAILDGFDAYERRFRIITRRARVRFETGDYAGLQADSVERLRSYRDAVDPVVAEIRRLLGERVVEHLIWGQMKAVFSGLITARDDWDLAETFFNSITRQVFTTVGVDPRIEFVSTDFDQPPTAAAGAVYRSYGRTDDLGRLVADILSDVPIDAHYADLEGDAGDVGARLRRRLEEAGATRVIDRVEVLGPVFYRGRAAYVVGRFTSGSEAFPLVIALEHRDDGVVVDAVLTHENEVSILFSFTRSYFHVDTGRPYDIVRFLRRIMPRKRVAEIYIAIGANKHGKTELYRDLLRHMRSTDDVFEVARGKRGLVMIVFGLPGHEDVFKVIRDKPAYPKEITREQVREKYRQVFLSERGGRLMDVQSFEHVTLDRDRFASALLAELMSDAGETVHLDGERVVIDQLYVERRVIPLDVYVQEASPTHARAAVVDFGRAIKELAANDIFPGDLLLKNFGVTRHGRVVFYDYDELSTLTEVTFRSIPTPRTHEDEMSGEPWFAVGPSDVFPEELERFLGLQGDLREAFLSHHRDLFEPDYWVSTQRRLLEGEVPPVYPYRAAARLDR